MRFFVAVRPDPLTRQHKKPSIEQVEIAHRLTAKPAFGATARRLARLKLVALNVLRRSVAEAAVARVADTVARVCQTGAGNIKPATVTHADLKPAHVGATGRPKVRRKPLLDVGSTAARVRAAVGLTQTAAQGSQTKVGYVAKDAGRANVLVGARLLIGAAAEDHEPRPKPDVGAGAASVPVNAENLPRVVEGAVAAAARPYHKPCCVGEPFCASLSYLPSDFLCWQTSGKTRGLPKNNLLWKRFGRWLPRSRRTAVVRLGISG